MATNAELLARRNKAVPRGVATASTVFAARAENAEIWDVEGRRYIDFAGGIAVLNTGHRHPKVMAAVEAQLERFTHTAFQVMAYEPYIALGRAAERARALPGPTKTDASSPPAPRRWRTPSRSPAPPPAAPASSPSAAPSTAAPC